MNVCRSINIVDCDKLILSVKSWDNTQRVYAHDSCIDALSATVTY